MALPILGLEPPGLAKTPLAAKEFVLGRRQKLMYDLVYAGNEDYARAQKELEERFPNAVIQDASDFIHEGRFSIEVDLPTDEYRSAILGLGMFAISLDFQMFRMAEPKQALALVEQWKEAVSLKQKDESNVKQDRSEPALSLR